MLSGRMSEALCSISARMEVQGTSARDDIVCAFRYGEIEDARAAIAKVRLYVDLLLFLVYRAEEALAEEAPDAE